MKNDLFARVAMFIGGMLVGCYFSLGIAGAVAQTVNAQTVDFSPFALQAIDICVMVLTVIAGIVSKFAVSWLAAKTRLNDTEFEKVSADRVNDILLRAIDYAEMQAKTAVADPDSGITKVKIDNFFMRMAIGYAQGAMPDLIAQFGLTRDKLEERIRARLNAVVNVPPVNGGALAPVTSPATSLATAPARDG